MKTVPSIIATSYHKSLTSGRTNPGVFNCVNTKGDSVGEYVVKLKYNIETHNAGLLRELVGNLLAGQLGVDAPDPAIVEIDIELASAISDQKVSNAIKNSIGWNYGSKNITGGYSNWPNDKTIPSSLKQAATDIFIFDALIENPDRRCGKSNILWRNDELVVIDHEMAFSFLLPNLLPSLKPWLLANQHYLTDHIFYHQLRHTKLDLNRIIKTIESVTANFWEEIEKVVPNEWKGTEFQRIRSHVELVQQHLEDFGKEIRRVLQ